MVCDVVFRHRRHHRLGCPRCLSSPQSPIEFEIAEALQSHTEVDTTSGLADIILPRLNAAIEFDGYHYHRTRWASDAIGVTTLAAMGLTPMRLRHYRLRPVASTDLYYRGRPPAADFARAIMGVSSATPSRTFLLPAPEQFSFEFPRPHPYLDDVVGEDRQIRYVLANRYDLDPLTPTFHAAPDTFTFLSCLLHILDDPTLKAPRHWLSTPDPLLGVSPAKYLTDPVPAPSILRRDLAEDSDLAGLSPHTAALLTLLTLSPPTLLSDSLDKTADLTKVLTGVSA